MKYALFGLACLAAFAAHAAPLITESESKLPSATGGVATRGITRGPGIRIVSPDPVAESVKSPFSLKVAFEPRGGAKIDTANIRISYMKTPAVDLIDRIKPGLSEKGINLEGAEAPPGEHQIHLTVQDSEGRQTSTVINLKIVK
jgi:hypothetical protein